MSKTIKIKSDLDDIASIIEILQILKDIAANHFFRAAKRKERFEQFAEAFVGFFKMVHFVDVESPLVKLKSDTVGIVLITAEGGFMAEITSKIVKKGLREAQKYKKSEFIAVGKRGGDKLKLLTGRDDIMVFTNIEKFGLYRIMLLVKDYLVNQIMERKIGKVYIIYPKAINIDWVEPKMVKLLPAEELLSAQVASKDKVEKVIIESDLNYIIHYLADIWLSCRLYEMLEDCSTAGYAAQQQQIGAGLNRMQKEKKGLVLAFRKARRADIDKSLREVFTASLFTGGR